MNTQDLKWKRRTEARLTPIYQEAVETAVASGIDTIDMTVPHWAVIQRNKVGYLQYRIGDDLVRVRPIKDQQGLARIIIRKDEYLPKPFNPLGVFNK